MSPKKWLLLGLGWEIHKMSLENFMVPEKAVLKKKGGLLMDVCERITGFSRVPSS